jgi:urease accessory protein
MGEFPARIVAEDFVTPPELAEWQLALNGAGRIGGARLTLAERGGESHVAGLYEQIPIRVLPLDLGPAEPALVYLLNPTAGLMDGDAHHMEIHAGSNTRAVVTGQSATRIHPCLRGFCTQQWHVTVADGAILVVLPGPAIPFAGCRFFQRVQIELGKNAQLVWGDLWFAGRYARQEASERFQFDRLVQEMVIQRNSQLVFRDRFVWQGPWNDAMADWHFGGFPAAGTLFATGMQPDEAFSASDSTRSATFTTAAGDTCCRWTGSSDAVIRAVVENSLRWAAVMAKSSGAAWLLDGHQLARTHWFDVL